jgi:hypothetical protein
MKRGEQGACAESEFIQPFQGCFAFYGKPRVAPLRGATPGLDDETLSVFSDGIGRLDPPHRPLCMVRLRGRDEAHRQMLQRTPPGARVGQRRLDFATRGFARALLDA